MKKYLILFLMLVSQRSFGQAGTAANLHYTIVNAGATNALQTRIVIVVPYYGSAEGAAVNIASGASASGITQSPWTITANGSTTPYQYAVEWKAPGELQYGSDRQSPPVVATTSTMTFTITPGGVKPKYVWDQIFFNGTGLIQTYEVTVSFAGGAKPPIVETFTLKPGDTQHMHVEDDTQFTVNAVIKAVLGDNGFGDKPVIINQVTIQAPQGGNSNQKTPGDPSQIPNVPGAQQGVDQPRTTNNAANGDLSIDSLNKNQDARNKELTTLLQAIDTKQRALGQMQLEAANNGFGQLHSDLGTLNNTANVMTNQLGGIGKGIGDVNKNLTNINENISNVTAAVKGIGGSGMTATAAIGAGDIPSTLSSGTTSKLIPLQEKSQVSIGSHAPTITVPTHHLGHGVTDKNFTFADSGFATLISLIRTFFLCLVTVIFIKFTYKQLDNVGFK